MAVGPLERLETERLRGGDVPRIFQRRATRGLWVAGDSDENRHGCSEGVAKRPTEIAQAVGLTEPSAVVLQTASVVVPLQL